MNAGNALTLVISVVALGISAYGVLERRNAAWRAERIRFAAIMDDLNKVHLEHVQAPEGLAPGDITDAINARTELLAAQGRSLLPRLQPEITSPELRTLAHALGKAGTPQAADPVWRQAIARSEREGSIPVLFAHRGYGYFLFRQGRLDEARAHMSEALASVQGSDDALRVHQVQTLKYWADAESAAAPHTPEIAADLNKRAASMTEELTSHRLKQQMKELLAQPAVPPSD